VTFSVGSEQTLVDALEELVALLEQRSEARWGSRLREDLRFLKNQDAYGAERFLSYRGGTGSLNDFVLCQINGHSIEKSREDEVNTRFAALRDRAWELAHAAVGSTI
jgi:hypothetical protein